MGTWQHCGCSWCSFFFKESGVISESGGGHEEHTWMIFQVPNILFKLCFYLSIAAFCASLACQGSFCLDYGCLLMCKSCIESSWDPKWKWDIRGVENCMDKVFLPTSVTFKWGLSTTLWLCTQERRSATAPCVTFLIHRQRHLRCKPNNVKWRCDKLLRCTGSLLVQLGLLHGSLCCVI